MNNVERVERTVIDHMMRGDMFTSVDIANSIKEDGTWIKNRQVANVLRDRTIVISDSLDLEYISAPIRVANGSEEALLYFPNGADRNEYRNSDSEAMTPDEFATMHGTLIDAAFNSPLMVEVQKKAIDDGGIINTLKRIFRFPKV